MNRRIFFACGIIALFSYLIVIFSPVFFQEKLPIPADTVVGLYHPFRDWQAPSYPNGIPFKNPLVTDPVRQQFVWRELAISNLLHGKSITWNPYMFTGAFLAGNPQTAIFYPLNLIYFLTPFANGWTAQIIIQFILGLVFMYLFLKRRVEKEAAILGALAWVGSGFFVAWSTLNALTQSAIWLPLILLSIELVLSGRRRHIITLGFALAASFLAGAWQIFLYIILFSFVYTIREVTSEKRLVKHLLYLAPSLLIALILVTPQILASWPYFVQGTRSIETANLLPEGWFMPPIQLIQFLIPDYFGNPATGNYFGVWNYMEFIGYVGMTPLLFAAIFVFQQFKRSLFWLVVIAVAIVSMLPNPLMTFYAQPTRVIILVCFSLSVLSSFGANEFLKNTLTLKKLARPIVLIGLILLVFIWYALTNSLAVTFRNSQLPLAIFLLSAVLIATAAKLAKNIPKVIFVVLLAVTVFDLSRVYLKFTPFSSPEWLFPKTAVTTFLSSHLSGTGYRFASLDDRIMPPNFSSVYRLPTISGYDSTFPKQFSELMIAIERNKPDTSRPWGYNRIMSPKQYQSNLFPILSVKYLLSFDELPSPLVKVANEGLTNVYEVPSVLPPVRSVDTVICRSNDQELLKIMFSETFDPEITAVCKSRWPIEYRYFPAIVSNIKFDENTVSFKSTSDQKSFLVLSENHTPGSTVNIDGANFAPLLVNYAFQGVEVPAGVHRIVWKIN